MSSTMTTLAELPSLKGSVLGVSNWVEITQERINRFADATGDHQWIHVDPERRHRESPFGVPIAPRFSHALPLRPAIDADPHRLRRHEWA